MKKATETVTTSVELSNEEKQFLDRMKKRSRSVKTALPVLWGFM